MFLSSVVPKLNLSLFVSSFTMVELSPVFPPSRVKMFFLRLAVDWPESGMESRVSRAVLGYGDCAARLASVNVSSLGITCWMTVWLLEMYD